jgi:hypothetical protein
MASFGSSTAAIHDRWFRRERLSHPHATPDGGDPRTGPSVWIILAEDAFIAGRIGQAEELVEQAYLVYDEAMTNVAADCLRFGEEESELDPK